MQKDEAAIVDVGGESTSPWAEEVGVEKELRRVLHAIHLFLRYVVVCDYIEVTWPGKNKRSLIFVTHIHVHLCSECQDIILSIHTWYSSVAIAAIEAGANIVGDVSGGTHDPLMLSPVAAISVPISIRSGRSGGDTSMATGALSRYWLWQRITWQKICSYCKDLY